MVSLDLTTYIQMIHNIFLIMLQVILHLIYEEVHIFRNKYFDMHN